MADVNSTTKWCYKCKSYKPRELFSKLHRSKDGLQNICKPCVNSYTRKNKEKKLLQDRERYRNNKDEWRNQSFNRKYGIGLSQYNSMLDKQKGKCAICNCECPSNRRLSVDHSHKTGIVRGLLCIHCNQALGHFKDDPKLIRKAIDYLLNRDHMI
jgi:Recombination endonuclease VII